MHTTPGFCWSATVHALPFPDVSFCSAFLDDLHTPDALHLGANLLQVRQLLLQLA